MKGQHILGSCQVCSSLLYNKLSTYYWGQVAVVVSSVTKDSGEGEENQVHSAPLKFAEIISTCAQLLSCV